MAEQTPSAKPHSGSVFENDLPGQPISSPLSTSSIAPAQCPVSRRLPPLLTPVPSSFPPEAPTSPLPSTSVPTPFSVPPPQATALLVPSFPSRVTRASARQAESGAISFTLRSELLATSAPTVSSGSGPAAPCTSTISPKPSFRKRKALGADGATNHTQKSPTPPTLTSRRSKRPRFIESTSPTLRASPSLPPAASTRSRKRGSVVTMSGSGGASSISNDPDDAIKPRASSRERTSAQDMSSTIVSSSISSGKSPKHGLEKQDLADTIMTGTDEPEAGPPPSQSDEEPDDEESDGDDGGDLHRFANDGPVDPFGGSFSESSRGSGLPSTLSMLGGMFSMSSMGSRLRELLGNLRQKDDPSVQLIALQDLSEIFLVSNEDNLSGSFSPDSYVRELVALMQPNEVTGEENPEVMLLACRCLANLMEALPVSVANVVYGGAVPVLCQKLLEISFIDLAEQALSTLEKISVEYPASIVREGGLTACLSYLEFFATGTQRTAVTTAANCCRNIPEDSFPVVRDVMPILLGVLNSNDQRVVEQAALCVSRIVESFKNHTSKLEELVGVDLLKAVLRLLLPGSTNHLIGPNLHTQFLRVLAISASDSPRLAAELFKMNVVETLYQILTGVSPPVGTDDIASKLDCVLIMQALIHRPREQIIETLNVICNLLPREVDVASISYSSSGVESHKSSSSSTIPRKRLTSNEKRIGLLNSCKAEVRRFALILFPTLTDAYSSTVNLDVRIKVLSAQIRMLSNFDKDVVLEALKAVPYASFLASILSQHDHPVLVKLALQATELLMSRLDDVYRYQLYREGVISEIESIASFSELESESGNEPMSCGSLGSDDADISEQSSAEASDNHSDDELFTRGESSGDVDARGDTRAQTEEVVEEGEVSFDIEEDEEDRSGSQQSSDEEEDDEIDNGIDDHPEEAPGSPASSEESKISHDPPPRRYIADAPSRAQIARYAKRFLDRYETEKNGKTMRKKATKNLSNLCNIAEELSDFYLKRSPASPSLDYGVSLFKRLAVFFDSDVFESATSAELLASGVVRILELVFSNPESEFAIAAQSAFLEVFMGHPVKSRPKTATADSPATPFSVLIHKLQDLLSRSEHFEVITVHHNTFDGNHSSAASMLAKQIRLRLIADDESDVPRAFRSIMVSIHAIATFKTLEDYLRPRISLSDRPRSAKHDGLTRALAAMASSARDTLGAAGTPRLSDRGMHFLAGSSLLSQHSQSSASGASKGPVSHQNEQTVLMPTPPTANLRSTRRSPKTKLTTQQFSNAPADCVSNAVDQSFAFAGEDGLRRSPRRPLPQLAEGTPSRPPRASDAAADALECTDEKQITGDDDGPSDHNALNSVTGDIDEEMSSGGTRQSSAVSLEIAAGGKITARKADGTRIPTPSQGSPSVLSSNSASALTTALKNSSAAQSSPTPSRLASYAAVVQSVPQDWHVEFTLNGKVVPLDSTVYRAVMRAPARTHEHTGRSIWSTIHSVHYRRVPGPNPPEPAGFGPFLDATGSSLDSDASDLSSAQGAPSKSHATPSILRLLKILHDLNANIDEILVANKDTLKLNVEPLSQFVNTKLTAKLNRQLEEPLIVASNCLPNWSVDLARMYPFLFPFETRHLFLQSTSFGYARSMARWQNSQVQDETRRDRRDDRPFLGRLQRQKVRISRSKILESAVKVMELYGASQSILEVEYFEEVGTGLGPTLEFYSTVSKEFSRRKLKLWRDNDLNDQEFVSSPNGLFPRPLSDEDAASANGERILGLFKTLGKFVARSMLDSRIIDIHLNPIFFRIGDETSGVQPSLGAVKIVDPPLARSLLLIKKFAIAKKEIEEDPHRSAQQKVIDMQYISINNTHMEDLSLDFTLPGHPEIELVPGGVHTAVTIDNVGLYLERVIAMTLGTGVRRQVDAFRKGFSQVFPYLTLSAFTPDELVSLFGRVDEDWSLETLTDSIKADHGFNMDSRSVKNLLQVMSELSSAERRDFLRFTTGSPKLPIGGFRSLTPMFTVVCRSSEAPYTSDDYLPSVMTCVNYLKLPDYSSIDVLRRQLFIAINEGQGAFHLS